MPALDIRHIVFDIGRVLIHFDPELAYLELIPDPGERQRFLDEVCTPAWNLEQDRGRGWPDGEAQLIARYPQHADAIRAYRANWHAMVPHAYPDTVGILDALIAQRRDVTLLTNFAADTFRLARQRFPFLQQTRGVTVSGEVGLVKPDPAIYQLHARSFGLAPERTLFIDDMPINVETARDVGWQALQYVDAPTLREQLVAMRLLMLP